MEITYQLDVKPTPEQVIELYDQAGLRRPTQDRSRIAKMYEHSNLIVTAWYDEKLVGVARSVTDWVWSCYLADLAILPDYQRAGIGKKLIALTKEKVGDQSMVLLLSVPTAFQSYPKMGFIKYERSFISNRKE